MKTRNSVASLAARLSATKVDGASFQSLLSGGAGVGNAGSRAQLSRLGGSTNEMSRSSLSLARASRGIDFGAPSSGVTKSSASSQDLLTTMLKRAASGGLHSAFGGGVLTAIGGIGGIISGISSLFGGGKKTLPPLVRFALPAEQNETAYVGSRGASTYAGIAVEQSQSQASGGPIYQGQPKTGSASNQQIVNAVKQALLHSSSLNDVIAEI
jgi:hypothetical protein